jgi:hypothetical protein
MLDNTMSQARSVGSGFIRICEDAGCHTDSLDSEVQDILIDGNFFFVEQRETPTNSLFGGVSLSGGNDITIRNNIFDLRGMALTSGTSLLSGRLEKSVFHGNQGNIHVLNNTVFADQVSNGAWKMCSDHNEGENNRCDGNLAFVPNHTGTRTTATGNYTAEANVWATAYAHPPFEGTMPPIGESDSLDFLLTDNAMWVDAGPDYSRRTDMSVGLDHDSDMRPANATWDVGAQERAGEPTGASDSIKLFVLPDTQNMTRNHCGDSQACLADLQATVDWVCANRQKEQIEAVIHLGDLVEWGPSAGDWANWQGIRDTLARCRMAQVLTIGNHDYDGVYNFDSDPAPSTYGNWTENAGEWMQSFDWFAGMDGTHSVPAYGAGNTFWVHPSGGVGILSIGWGAWNNSEVDREADREFVVETLANNPGTHFILVSHGAASFNASLRWDQRAARTWINDLVNEQSNIIAVIGGHWTACGGMWNGSTGPCGDSHRDYFKEESVMGGSILTVFQNYQTNDRNSNPFYNWQGYFTIWPASKEICYRSIRVHPQPVRYDLDGQDPGGVETCVSYR